MKVRVAVTVEIDPEAWVAEYGLGPLDDVRRDVLRWAESALHSQLQAIGVGR